MVNPPIKWCGGKRQLLPELHSRIPKQFDVYVEPFFGGGALFFSLDSGKPKQAIINDYNSELINFYREIGRNYHQVCYEIDRMPREEADYYRIRATYDVNPIWQAARFLYLNKLGFNGLYRVNKKGGFNVPYGKNPEATIYDTKNLGEVSHRLRGAAIYSGSYLELEDKIRELRELDKSVFIYLDPPYIPLVENSFTSYTAAGFTHQNQIELEAFVHRMSEIRVKVMQSNSSSPITLELYKDYNIEFVKARRAVNSDASKRGKIDEVIIRNYD